jgi:putative transposase
MLTTCYGFKLKDNKLRLPIKSHVYEYIPLNRHTLEVLSKPSLTARSVTLTDSTVSINFSKETVEIEPTGLIGIDRNLNNVTVCDNKGNVEQIDLSRATEIKETYRNIKSHFVRNDVRIRRRIFGKYGAKQRNIVSQILHKTSKRIVQEALESKYAIVMENLKGIRKLYRKGNGQGRNYRSRLNSWSFYELQRQIEYKALWEGLPVIYVPARGTSIKCSLCGSALQPIPEENRNLKCSTHGIVDRDVNASRNIVKLGMRFVPIALPSEAMVVECQTETNPQSRWK